MDVLAELKRLAAPHDIRVVDRGRGHVQLHGRQLVNYYPFSRNRTAYVDGTQNGRRGVTVNDAILMALTPAAGAAPAGKPGKRKRKPQRKAKLRLLARTPRVGEAYRCWYCQRLFIPDLLTVEHLVPVSKGGANTDDNKVLACAPCNQGRGNRMPLIPPKLEGR